MTNFFFSRYHQDSRGMTFSPLPPPPPPPPPALLSTTTTRLSCSSFIQCAQLPSRRGTTCLPLGEPLWITPSRVVHLYLFVSPLDVCTLTTAVLIKLRDHILKNGKLHRLTSWNQIISPCLQSKSVLFYSTCIIFFMSL